MACTVCFGAFHTNGHAVAVNLRLKIVTLFEMDEQSLYSTVIGPQCPSPEEHDQRRMRSCVDIGETLCNGGEIRQG